MITMVRVLPDGKIEAAHESNPVSTTFWSWSLDPADLLIAWNIDPINRMSMATVCSAHGFRPENIVLIDWQDMHHLSHSENDTDDLAANIAQWAKESKGSPAHLARRIIQWRLDLINISVQMR